MFDADLVQAGPQEPETTEDPLEAILWALSGIHTTMRAIHNEMRGWQRARGAVHNVTNLSAAEIIRQGREEEE